ncbi:hypothetical protein [Tuwongella immobilis]|uniref:hypothetical protein n=1 Tax=Tuwongella immobilis TaxID=692036 RepID=UPI0013A6DF43|nr:hypothetical protein [Tuwongella immobilis]
MALRTPKPNVLLRADPNLRIHKGGEFHTNEDDRLTDNRLQDAVDGAGTDWATQHQALFNELDKMRVEIAAGAFP